MQNFSLRQAGHQYSVDAVLLLFLSGPLARFVSLPATLPLTVMFASMLRAAVCSQRRCMRAEAPFSRSISVRFLASSAPAGIRGNGPAEEGQSQAG